MASDARILLTGATGFIGRALAAALRARGNEVVEVSRRGPVDWDRVDTEVARADAVVHLAGEPIADGRWTPERLERIRSSRVDTTRQLARALAAADAPASRVFISGSAVGIYGMRMDDVVCDESTPPGDDVLARIGVDWERAADPARDAGVRVAHPRTGIVLGRGGGALEKMRRPFELFTGGPLGSGRQWLSWIHLRDAVRALLFALDHAELSGPFDVVAPEPATMNDFAKALGHALGRPSLFRVPAFALRAALGDGVAELLLTGQRVVPRRLADAGFTFDFPRLDEALRDLR
jgi:uncharacterized protein (TIGR01777 family)